MILRYDILSSTKTLKLFCCQQTQRIRAKMPQSATTLENNTRTHYSNAICGEDNNDEEVTIFCKKSCGYIKGMDRAAKIKCQYYQ